MDNNSNMVPRDGGDLPGGEDFVAESIDGDRVD